MVQRWGQLEEQENDVENLPVKLTTTGQPDVLLQNKDLAMLVKSAECDPYTHVTIQPVEVIAPEDFEDNQAYRTKKVSGKAIYLKDKSLDVLCYPELYPTGTNGMYSDRLENVKPALFLKHRFHHKDSRFRKNIQYLLQNLADTMIDQLNKACTQL